MQIEHTSKVKLGQTLTTQGLGFDSDEWMASPSIHRSSLFHNYKGTFSILLVVVGTQLVPGD